MLVSALPLLGYGHSIDQQHLDVTALDSQFKITY